MLEGLALHEVPPVPEGLALHEVPPVPEPPLISEVASSFFIVGYYSTYTVDI